MACKKKIISHQLIYIHVYIFKKFICYQISMYIITHSRCPLLIACLYGDLNVYFTENEMNDWHVMHIQTTETRLWTIALQKTSGCAILYRECPQVGVIPCWPVNRPWWDTGPAVEGMDSRVWTPDFHWWTRWLHIMDFFIHKVRV